MPSTLHLDAASLAALVKLVAPQAALAVRHGQLACQLSHPPLSVDLTRLELAGTLRYGPLAVQVREACWRDQGLAVEFSLGQA